MNIGTVAGCLIVSLALPNAFADSVPRFTDEGYTVPQPGREFTFPADHGAHPEFKIEWWYLTGHLETASERPFGFQATFFRFGGPLEGSEPNHLGFGNHGLFSTHVALTDIDGGRFFFDQRLDRAGWNARARVGRLVVEHGAWHLHQPDSPSFSPMLRFSPAPNVEVRLNFQPQDGLVIFGEDGTSRKGPDPAARSYYLTFPRLQARGEVTLDGESFAVTGEAWMDHEIASKQLSEDLVGWDWTAIQLDDGREIKAYVLRQPDGTPSPFSRLIWLGAQGEKTYLQPGEHFRWERLGWWRSEESGIRYPTHLRIHTVDPESGKPVSFELKPRLAAQEIIDDLADTSYWEGACEVLKAEGKRAGLAYLELVGYGDAGAPTGLR
ncbi:MAG: lipocalin-like domain-containing protein [Opitutales bacterium]